MKSTLAIALTVFSFFATTHAVANEVCDTLTKVSVSPGQAGAQIGGWSFTLKSGQSYSNNPNYTYQTSTGNLLYADPLSAGVVSTLTLAFINHAKVCYDTDSGTVTLK